MYCTIRNETQQLDSELLKPYLKKLLFFVLAFNSIWYQAAVTLNEVLLCGRGQLKCDGTRAETRFHLPAKRTRPFKSASGHQFSRLLAAEVGASAVVMLDTPCSEVVWRVLATHCIRQFPLHFPSRASPCAITFQLESNSGVTLKNKHPRIWMLFRNGTVVAEILITAQKNEKMPASKCRSAKCCMFSSTETYKLFVLLTTSIFVIQLSRSLLTAPSNDRLLILTLSIYKMHRQEGLF